MKTDIVRTFAALNATNEAILYAKSPEELYRKVSEAAFSSGDFLASAIFLLEPGTDLLRFAAGFGDDIARLRSIDISIVAGTPEGSGVCGQAFRDRKVIVSNDFLNDARSLAWRDGAEAATGRRGGGAAADLQRPQRRRLPRHPARTRVDQQPDRFDAASACRRTFPLRSTISIMRPRARTASGRCAG